MVLMNDERTYDRCRNYHDTGACWRPDRFAEQRYEGELFVGSNYRMSELAGAVLCAQEKKLDGLIAKMRRNQQRIIDGISDIPTVKVRPRNDDAGDIAICLMFYLADKEKVPTFVEALKAEGVAAAGVFNSGIPDWHIYAHWKHVIDKKTPTEVPCPYDCPYHKSPVVDYSTDMNPKTIDLLSRVVHIDIPPQMNLDDCDMIAHAIRKCAEALL